MASKIIRGIVLLSIAVLIGGCVGAANVQRSEVEIYSRQNTRTLADTIHYADLLAGQYIALSDRASGVQDVTAVGLIASAGVAAGAMLYDANLNLVKGAGLAAGTIAAGSAYFRPGETSAALLDAAEQLICIRKAGEPYLEAYRTSEDAGEIVNGGILNVRVNLRKKLSRTLPDYRSLVESLKDSIVNQPAAKAGVVQIPTLGMLRTDVATCLLPGS
ncbi:hypothetical protein [Rhizobium ruizarguesonis]|uniref:hypothetical protein n=1 Tax=Rhizobium ruizarguesonis TaxID=2081791 RepID=UPI0010312502|nr:hypothetical protein [Rhizobium ruizarguesonis]TBC68295.1 hypothetical protein ELH28_38435 [Rhizobium ruizarguesonis]TBD93669.1 hypothetical protein ELH10_35045 [Rhizobium ruizarguesonis]TBF03668.1 hypothetical protein ELG95_32765 [Rhizobium ruizarguesonis]